ncbi:Oligopeptide ABC transporter, periplasmic oligopeptide-binding protein OppA [Methanosarcina horonobensis HB-1 = JCM 15518]|uniref:Oligopeptide ABC transporter, periplasmic oligopeptide-binding protein OppA n=1 Tax=Methanosarcina horonobensis HB-1 = JCM 15518 TaxID=1434110 RepID=A0A0E3WV59_9EURY|nr:ABC transporter substrate-binding protein [Methanosarcina horonobensis]AKB80005.1 Oligopeptide ABC transporter, periplasmic oligopeptide-binding protein OppA [Methanosarcina horonobensis HB-1 = JCM 15518]
MKQRKNFTKSELNRGLKQWLIFAVLTIIVYSNIYPAVAAEPENSEENLTPSNDGIFDRIITYIKSLLGDEEKTQVSGAVSEAAAAGMQQSADTGGAVLKIATPSVIKSPSFLGDSNLGVFAHLSNPPLMKMDSEGHLVGQLAESYEVSENNTCWTFYLRDDLYWSDGEPVTPKDIEFSIRYYGKEAPSARWINDTLESAAVSEANNSVTFKFNKPYTRIDLEFATYNILPAHIWETIENPVEYTNNGPYVGCGPYYLKLIDLNAGKLVFEKNPYWKGKAPEPETVEIHFYSSVDVATLALKNGEIDTYYKYAGSYPYSGIEQLEETGNFDFIEKTDIGLVFLALNLKKAPFSDTEFREALAYAINYEEIVSLETLGYGEVPNRGFVPSSMENFKETERLEYSPEKAREILEKAGYSDSNGNGILEGKDGKDIKLEILIRPEYSRTGELLEEYLEQVGLASDLRTADADTWVTLKDNYEYDLTVTRSTPWGMLMHASWGSGYFDSRRTGQGVMHNLDDPEFMQLCDNILATTDSQELQSYAYELQNYYAENLPAIPLYWSSIVTPYNRHFEGWYTDPLYGIYNLDNFVNVRKIEA